VPGGLVLAAPPAALAGADWDRLDPGSTAPLAVAFSGGGDSTALLLMARGWARAHGRPLLALTVDHRLQAASAGWAQACAALCERLGVAHRTLVWDGGKPVGGLAAAARLARHRLLADAARDAGARVILMAHTADDRLEASLMRAAGSTVPDPRVWAPSPVWPQGRGIFLLRPLLSVRRAALRAWLAGQGVGWIEDPANAAKDSLRARVRRDAAALPDPPPPEPPPIEPLAFTPSPAQSLSAPIDLLTLRQLAAAVACAAGAPPPRTAAVQRLLRRLQEEPRVTATLAGARIEAVEGRVCITRDAGDLRRRPRAPATGVWDGRYELRLPPGAEARPLAGAARRLPKAEQAALRAVAAPLRPSLPLVVLDNRATCPVLAQDPEIPARGLVYSRFRGALGAICREAAIERVADDGPAP
jgi:tRNA(Ile)-lysidine synthase